MSSSKCEIGDCGDDATMFFARISRRIIVAEDCTCQRHGADMVNRYLAIASDDREVDLIPSGTVRLDLDFMVSDSRPESQPLSFTVHLREVGGSRRIAVRVGYFEGWALEVALRKAKCPRPLTFPLIECIIRGLDAQLHLVLIDQLDLPDEIYHAKLWLVQATRTVVVDARVSDALCLAVVCSAPIFAATRLAGRV
jgi:bifunctional DNase/RNase